MLTEQEQSSIKEASRDQQLCSIACCVADGITTLVFNKAAKQFVVDVPIQIRDPQGNTQFIYDASGTKQTRRIMFTKAEIDNLVFKIKTQMIDLLNNLSFLNKTVKDGTVLAEVCNQELLKEMPQLADVLVEAEKLSGVKVDIV